jgi:AraC-like DNA-binding protein
MKKIPVYGVKEFGKSENGSFYANDLSSHLITHQFVNSPHKHDSYIVVFFTRGVGLHHIDFDSYQVRPGSIFILSPGQVHWWKLSKDAEGFVFIHSKEFYDRIFVNRKIQDFPFFFLPNNQPAIYLNKIQRNDLEILFELILKKYKGKSSNSIQILGSLIDLVYLQLAELYQPSTMLTKPKISNYLKVRKLQKLIDDHYLTKKFPKEYADLMNMSIRHLNRITKESLQKTTGDLIVERILLEAKRMLILKDSPISTIAEDLGYEDHSYFIRMFRKNLGISPKEFQKMDFMNKVKSKK